MPENAIFWLVGSASMFTGVWLGYELSRSARVGKPLIRLPRFRKKKVKQRAREYTL